MTIYHSTPRRRQFVVMAWALALMNAAFLFPQSSVIGAGDGVEGRSAEELVQIEAVDHIPNGGVVFVPPKNSAKRIAVIWIHGWGVNFYQPTYVKIGRSLAERGYTTIIGNTRMHDYGNVTWLGDKRIRGGGIWGVASEQVRDIAAWIDFAEARGFKQVILVGHSAGWAAVTQYQAERQDRRVIGVVVASGNVPTGRPMIDPDLVAQATRMMAAGHPDELVRDPKRSFPSYTSAATLLDIINTPPEFQDFYGTQAGTKNPGVTRIHCPLLAFYGTRGDVGNDTSLKLLKSSIGRQSSGPSRVDTLMIQNADHMYTSEEIQVAQVLAKWADTLNPQDTARVQR